MRGPATPRQCPTRRRRLIDSKIVDSPSPAGLPAIDANLETDARGERTAYGSSFWIRKAIGWALRQQARTDPQWTLDFVADHRDRMAGLSIREALKHLD